jgi:hypothetical protein
MNKTADFELDGSLPGGLFPQLRFDADPRETSEWVEALDYVISSQGADRAAYLLTRLKHHAFRRNVNFTGIATTPYINTISVEDQPPYPGDGRYSARISLYSSTGNRTKKLPSCSIVRKRWGRRDARVNFVRRLDLGGSQ